VIGVLVMLSIILTAATVFPDMTGETIIAVLGGGSALGCIGFAVITLAQKARGAPGGQFYATRRRRRYDLDLADAPLANCRRPQPSLTANGSGYVVRFYLSSSPSFWSRSGCADRDSDITRASLLDLRSRHPRIQSNSRPPTRYDSLIWRTADGTDMPEATELEQVAEWRLRKVDARPSDEQSAKARGNSRTRGQFAAAGRSEAAGKNIVAFATG